MKKLIALIVLVSITGIALGHGGGHGGGGHGGGFGGRGGGFGGRGGGYYGGGRGGYYVGGFGPGYYYGSDYYDDYEPYGAVGVAEDVAQDGWNTAEDITDDTVRTIGNIL